MIKVLDCTFRDGGYYTDWFFDNDVFQRYLNAMSAASVDYVEIGFKTLTQKKVGPWAYCEKDFLSQFDFPSNCKYGVMINAADFFSISVEDFSNILKDIFSKIEFIRVCAHFHEIEKCDLYMKEIKKHNILSCFNIMQIAGKSKEVIQNAVEEIKSWEAVEVLYFADSLGALDHVSVKDLYQTIREKWDGEIGIHGHNNKGMALPNTLGAIDLGITWLDGTVLGMGRGAGNTQIELLLIELKRLSEKNKNINKNYNPQAISKICLNDFEKLRDKYQWGPNLFYHISAEYGIHPFYIQELLSDKNYDKEQVLNGVMNLTKAKNPNKFSKDKLRSAMHGNPYTKTEGFEEILKGVKIIIPARCRSTRFPNKPLVDLMGKSLIQRVWERCCLVLPEEDVYIATEDEEIQDHCEKLGINCIMTTSKCLTGTDRVYEASLNLNSDLIVNVQGDEPLISPEDIMKVIKSFREDPESVHCGMCDIKEENDFLSSSIPKVVAKSNNELLYMSRAPIPTTKKQEFIEGKKQVCIYAFPKKALKDFGECGKKSKLESIEDIEILRFFELGYKIKMVDVSDSSIAVDFPHDVDRVIEAIKSYEELYG